MNSWRRICLLLAEDTLTQVIMFWDKKKRCVKARGQKNVLEHMCFMYAVSYVYKKTVVPPG